MDWFPPTILVCKAEKVKTLGFIINFSGTNFTLSTKNISKFLDGKNVSTLSCHTISYTLVSYNRLVRVSEGSNKNIFSIKLQLSRLKNKQRFLQKEGVSLLNKEIRSIPHKWCEIPTIRNELVNLQGSWNRNPRLRFLLGYSKRSLFVPCFEDVRENLNRQLRLGFRFERTKSGIFFLKKFEFRTFQFFTADLANLNFWRKM